MDRHCRRAWQAEANPSRTAGTSRRTSAGIFAEARPPAASSWCVPNTFPPAATDVHILKGEREYKIARQFQHTQARKAGINYSRRSNGNNYSD